MAIPDIMACIGDDIAVGSVPVGPGFTGLGRVRESKTEDSVPGEGTIFFDIRFSAYPKGNAGVKFLINLEAQKVSSYSGLHYHLENRIVFYLCRMVSAQKNTEFYHSDYDSLRNVRSIWICMDRKKDGDSIEEISLVRKTIFGKTDNSHTIDLMQGIIINIRNRENVETSQCALISMLEVLFSQKSVADKKNILEKEYGILMTTEMEGRLNTMCNFSEFFIEEGLERGELNRSRQAILDLLEDLGDIPQDIHARIDTEDNMEALRMWLKIAAKAISFDVFREKIEVSY